MSTSIMVHATNGIITAEIADVMHNQKALRLNVIRQGCMKGEELIGGDNDGINIFATKQQLISLSEQIIESTRLMVCADCDYLAKKNSTECEHGWSWPDCEDNEPPDKEEHDIPDYLFEGER